MTKLKIESGDWVVICDGRKALLLQNAGDSKFPNLRTVQVLEHLDPPTHELGGSPPGRSHPSVGTSRSSVEQTDWHDEAERTFLHSLAVRMDTALKAKETRALIVVAPPRALGMLRQAYTPHVRGALRAEIDKDLVHVPIHDIEKRLFS
jgi:protein required for attachment to host cells